MLVVNFSAKGDGNCVVVEGRPFVLARTGKGSFLVRASCPHRGGPLHLADLDATGDTLVCPWHENGYPFTRSRESVIPVVRSANRVTAVFPGKSAASYTREYRPMSRCLSGQDPSGESRSPRTGDHPVAQRSGVLVPRADPDRMRSPVAPLP
jgi:hypothetical protein